MAIYLMLNKLSPLTHWKRMRFLNEEKVTLKVAPLIPRRGLRGIQIWTQEIVRDIISTYGRWHISTWGAKPPLFAARIVKPHRAEEAIAALIKLWRLNCARKLMLSTATFTHSWSDTDVNSHLNSVHSSNGAHWTWDEVRRLMPLSYLPK